MAACPALAAGIWPVWSCVLRPVTNAVRHSATSKIDVCMARADGGGLRIDVATTA
jgi:hypothetical protein